MPRVACYICHPARRISSLSLATYASRVPLVTPPDTGTHRATCRFCHIVINIKLFLKLVPFKSLTCFAFSAKINAVFNRELSAMQLGWILESNYPRRRSRRPLPTEVEPGFLR
jgi:hypothetical protein